jgi:large-conductance mechanosensitive channel
MQEAIDRLVRDVTLVTLALAIGLGWSLFQVAQGVADVVTNLLRHVPPGDVRLGFTSAQPLTWIVGDRVLTLNSLLTGLIDFVVVLALALLVLTHARRDATGVAR